MALLAKSEENILISAQRSIFVLSTKDDTHSVCQVPQIPRKKAENGAQNKQDDNNDDNADEDEKEQGNAEFGDINRLAVSSCSKYVAVTTIGDKFLFLYKLDNGALSLLHSHQLSRAISVIRFTPDSKALLIADKTGDCSILNIQSEQQSEAKWILGHLSIVLDVLMTENSKYVISCDRDEKIRVTNYPLTEVVESYCLGHTEFVSAIDELQFNAENVLVSLSGDKTLRLWRYVDGKELFLHELPARGLRLARNTQNQLAVVSFDDDFSVGIYELGLNDNKPEIRVVAQHKLGENVKYVGSVVYVSEDKIWLSCLDENNEPLFKQLEITRLNDETKIIETNVDNALNALKQNLTSTKLQPCDDIATLFKSRVDNTADYLERKRQRLEKNRARFL